jgi:hypothetical protein
MGRPIVTIAGLSLVAVMTPSLANPANRANDLLAAQSPKEQAAILGRAVNGSDPSANCQGVTAFYQGEAKDGVHAGEAIWSVRCADGKSFQVDIHPDGSGTTLDCGLLRWLGNGKETCFKKY